MQLLKTLYKKIMEALGLPLSTYADLLTIPERTI